jgi:hypothetical protein
MRISAISLNIRKSLIKLLVATVVLVGLLSECFYQSDRGLVGVMAVGTAILALPIVILLSIDASRAIKREISIDKSTRVLGIFLGLPQAVLGILLMAIGIAYPFIGIRNILVNLYLGQPTIFPIISTISAIMMLIIGYYYLREGLSSGKKRDIERDDKSTH